MGKLRILRHHPDWLLTLLTAVLALMIFVFAPLQAAGVFLFQTFAIAGLLVIITAALVMSGNAIALWLMVIAFVGNFTVFFPRHRPLAPARQKSFQYREHHRPALSGNDSGETGNSRAGDQVRGYSQRCGLSPNQTPHRNNNRFQRLNSFPMGS